MKTKLLSVVFVLGLLSCESDLLENSIGSVFETDIQTKAVEVDFDPLVELRGIPV